jgi:hypothetical protein
MKRIVITMRSFKKFISHDLLQLALIISLLKVRFSTIGKVPVRALNTGTTIWHKGGCTDGWYGTEPLFLLYYAPFQVPVPV